MCWRYDPIFIHGQYTFDRHVDEFSKMAKTLSGYTDACVISFITLYEKTRRNFPGIRAVSEKEKVMFAEVFSEIGRRYGISIKTCAEATNLGAYGVKTSGCLAKEVIEKATGYRLTNTHEQASRITCGCYPSRDIGAYNTCLHGCLYCYANYDQKTVQRNNSLHDPNSPLLVGRISDRDIIQDAEQVRYADMQPLLL